MDEIKFEQAESEQQKKEAGALIREYLEWLNDRLRREHGMEFLEAAHALYRSVGFHDVDPYIDNSMKSYQPVEQFDRYYSITVFMEMDFQVRLQIGCKSITSHICDYYYNVKFAFLPNKTVLSSCKDLPMRHSYRLFRPCIQRLGRCFQHDIVE